MFAGPDGVFDVVATHEEAVEKGWDQRGDHARQLVEEASGSGFRECQQSESLRPRDVRAPFGLFPVLAG